MKKLLFEIINEKKDVEKTKENLNQNDNLERSDSSKETLFSKHKIILENSDVIAAQNKQTNEVTEKEVKPQIKATNFNFVIEKNLKKLSLNLFNTKIKNNLNALKNFSEDEISCSKTKESNILENTFDKLISKNLSSLSINVFNNLILTNLNAQNNLKPLTENKNSKNDIAVEIFLPKAPVINFENRISNNLSNQFESENTENELEDPILDAILEQLDMVKTLKTKLLSQKNISANKLAEIEKILDKNISLLEK